jgi:hypothetical protein
MRLYSVNLALPHKERPLKHPRDRDETTDNRPGGDLLIILFVY